MLGVLARLQLDTSSSTFQILINVLYKVLLHLRYCYMRWVETESFLITLLACLFKVSQPVWGSHLTSREVIAGLPTSWRMRIFMENKEMSSKRWRAAVKSNLKWSNELVESLLLALSNFIAKNLSSKAKILMQNLGSNYRSGKNYWEVINITWTIMSIHPYIRKFFFRSSNVSSSGHTSLYSSVIRQKHDFQNGCYMKKKHTKCFEKRTFLTPWYVHVRVRIRGS